jgi:PAS domain S-box-containing protein
MRRGHLRHGQSLHSSIVAVFKNKGRQAQFLRTRRPLQLTPVSQKQERDMASTEDDASSYAKTVVLDEWMADKVRLRRGLRAGCLYPMFQPIVRLPSRSIASFEVLARWNDEELGTVPPATFIPAVERAGLIAELTSNIIQSAGAAACAWNGEFRLAFNISPLQFQGVGLPSQIEAAVRLSGFPLSRVQLEITESAVIDDLAAARVAIDRLKALGVQVVLDDFGTGFSSLTRLQALPFDKIKIDGSFVRSMGTSRESRKIVGATIGLGQSLRMPVVAEGIETAAQLRMLAHLGCNFGQGYLFSRPLPAAEIPALIKLWGEQAEDPSPLDLSCNQRLAQLKAIYSSAPIALCFVDWNQRVVSANRRYAEMIEMQLGEIIGRRIEEVIPRTDPGVLADLALAVGGGCSSPREWLMPDRRHVALATIVTARDENNEMVGLLVALIDITQYRRLKP